MRAITCLSANRVRFFPLFAALLLVSTTPGSAVPVFVHDWTINTPVGRFGYAEIHYTLMMQTEGEPLKLYEVVFLGPLGEVPPPPLVAVGILFATALGLFYAVHRIRKRKNETDQPCS